MSEIVVLRLIVFVAGMATMATEMAASRLLAPFFGTSVLVWANVIGLILIYLSLGYWLGGRVADKHPNLETLGKLIGVAALTIGMVPFVAHPVLSATIGSIDALATATLVGSFGACILLFSVPVTLLGMVPPFAVRLAVRNVETAGGVAGGISALSTVGSILGVFVSVLVFIPWIGTRRCMLVFAIALALLSLLVAVRRTKLVTVGLVSALVIATLVPTGFVRGTGSSGEKIVYEDETPYQFVQVLRDSNGGYMLELNEGWAVHSYYLPGSNVTNSIWDHFALLPHMTSREKVSGTRMLIVGNAAGSTARVVSKIDPGVTMDGVEIDPQLTTLGYRYFDMPRPPVLNVHTADGRAYMQHAGAKRWDVIQLDAYRQPYIPFHLTTKEFFKLVKVHLAPGGIVAINVGTTPTETKLRNTIAKTMQSQFTSVFSYRAESSNWMLIATREPTSLKTLRQRLSRSDLNARGATHDLVTSMKDGLKVATPGPMKILTDDLAPVEWMTDRMIFEVAKTNGGGEY